MRRYKILFPFRKVFFDVIISKVLKVIKWMADGNNEDSLFWRAVVLSGQKLREQFDKIEAKMKSQIKNKNQEIMIGTKYE